jgi:plastocyanin
MNPQTPTLSVSESAGIVRTSRSKAGGIALLALALALAAGIGVSVASAAQRKVIEVHMATSADGASGRFKPAHVTAKNGDTVRFITDGRSVHNVSFPPSENPGRRTLPELGPYLTSPGQSYDLVVDLDAGTYHFQCDPHAILGMKGVLRVR